MRIEIIGRESAGTCDLTRKEGIEVWAVRPRGGEVTHVSTQRLPEVLRLLASVPDPSARTPTSATEKPKAGVNHSTS
ncbi:MAG: hypothetical protein KDA86_23900 [Planctomycetaceae bacterium]|nr:hypothetical protein [Planctomycetaceae bacterium]